MTSKTIALNTYEVGMGTDKQTIKAPSAGAAAMYYSCNLINTNNPFMAMVYTENGEEWKGESFWINPFPDEAHNEMVLSRLTREDILICQVVRDQDDPASVINSLLGLILNSQPDPSVSIDDWNNSMKKATDAAHRVLNSLKGMES